jgi:hypothetical protein
MKKNEFLSVRLQQKDNCKEEIGCHYTVEECIIMKLALLIYMTSEVVFLCDSVETCKAS